MNHDRIHAREPSHHVDRWSVGVIESLAERDGHCVVAVRSEARTDAGTDASPPDAVELVVTFAVRDPLLGRLQTTEKESPVGERVWYRKRGG